MVKRKTAKLTKEQDFALKLLASSPLAKTFYWTGGTALAFFYLNHRESYDLDFFTDKPFTYNAVKPFAENLSHKLRLKKLSERKVNDRWEFILKNGGTVRFEFVHYNFPALKSRRKWRGIFVDSLKDMAANKTMAMIDRKEPKDALDVYFLVTDAGLQPEALLDFVQKKFGAKFSPSLFWGEGLLGSRGLDSIQPLLRGSKEKKERTIRTVQTFFENGAAEFIRHRFQE